MRFSFAIVAVAGIPWLVCAQVQGTPPPPVLLTATKSGVLPVEPTPFNGVETEEGAIIYDGPPNPGFAGLNGPAVAQTNLPTATYVATLPSIMFDPYAGTNISGSIMAVGTASGVSFMVNLTGIPPASYGPFVYHVHALAVPDDGNCTSTLGHLDPTDRGEYFPCDPSQPQTCQAGDLAGKHGNITGVMFTASYVESYLSTDPNSAYFFGNKSVVIHTSNTTRLTCANFVMMNSSSTMTTTSTATATVAIGGSSGSSSSMSMMASSSGGSASASASASTVSTAGSSLVAVGLPGVLIAWIAACLLLV